MPTYDYVCDEGHEFTAEQKILDVPLAKCQVELEDTRRGPIYCDAAAHRVISKGTGFTLKGRGWAKDGYGS